MWDAQLCHGFVEPLVCVGRGGSELLVQPPFLLSGSTAGNSLRLLLCSDCSSSLVKSHLLTADTCVELCQATPPSVGECLSQVGSVSGPGAELLAHT